MAEASTNPRPLIEIPYAEAIQATEDCQRVLLLGNGFSIAAHPRFNYARLYDVAVKMDPSIATLFESLDTTNFEVAMNAALDEGDARAVRNGLIKAITHVHPYKSTTLDDREYKACGAFLAPFVGKSRKRTPGLIFTINYDLLLYWTVVCEKASLDCYDGFDNEDFWNPGKVGLSQMFFLHGGLHLFERGFAKKTRLSRLRWAPKRVLTDQIRERLARDEFPMFVAEGSSTDKQARIRKSEYLRLANRKFVAACGETKAAIFTVGHSLGESDDHINDVIGNAHAESVYIGVFSNSDRAHVNALADRWATRREREGRPPLNVRLFDTNKCPIWKPA